MNSIDRYAIPEEYNARIEQAEDYRDSSVSAIEVEDYGEGLFMVPFTVEVECFTR